MTLPLGVKGRSVICDHVVSIDIFSHLDSLRGMFVCLIDLILYVPSTIFQDKDGSSWVESVLS